MGSIKVNKLAPIVYTTAVSMLWITPIPEKKIEIAGRICTGTLDKITLYSSDEFIKEMLRSEHVSMLKYASACFHIIAPTETIRQIRKKDYANMDQTEIVKAGSFKAWRRFIYRLGTSNQPDQIEIAILIYNRLLHYAPNVFADMNPIEF